ncbi:uridine kinase [Bradyrhizobium sp.]|uniref:uridine kinase n=1 Tax=Bradyrhizobium sp. TaxID=376 RepID=UPI001DFDD18C|nr:uridine kinase [Bradyrhizobium sp.]MBI5323359.1 uridine kinase [Bradyrhizobium sp.]
MSETRNALLDRLAATIATLHPDRRIRVAIDGVDGAGKTMLADALAPLVIAKGREVIRASVDGFHNPRAVRYARGRHSPDGFYLDSYDYAAFRRLLLDPLGSGSSGNYIARHFDHRTDQPVVPRPQQAAQTVALIVDGIFLHRTELRECWDLSIFLQVDFAVSTARNAARDGTPEALDPEAPSTRRYVGGQQRYLAECNPQQAADIVIDYNDPGAPKILKWNSRSLSDARSDR